MNKIDKHKVLDKLDFKQARVKEYESGEFTVIVSVKSQLSNMFLKLGTVLS